LVCTTHTTQSFHAFGLIFKEQNNSAFGAPNTSQLSQ
jgi:hypothetical protein